MRQRSDDSFDLDDEFLGESSESDGDLDRLIVVERRPAKGPKRATQQQAAWSRVEDVLAERRLKRELTEFNEQDEF